MYCPELGAVATARPAGFGVTVGGTLVQSRFPTGTQADFTPKPVASIPLVKPITTTPTITRLPVSTRPVSFPAPAPSPLVTVLPKPTTATGGGRMTGGTVPVLPGDGMMIAEETAAMSALKRPNVLLLLAAAAGVFLFMRKKR